MNKQRTLLISFIIIISFMLVEALGGWFTNSLALLSDAGHMLSDAAALGATLLAFKMGEKAANKQKTYGYKRFEILVAVMNGTMLIIIAGMIFIEAIGRIDTPPEVATKGMLIIASIGMVVNIVVAWLLHRGGVEHSHAGHSHSNHSHAGHDSHHHDEGYSPHLATDEKNLNMHSAYLHVLSDLLGSVAAIAAALAMMWFGWWWADPLVSVIVAVLILVGGIRVVKASVHVLMQGVPSNIDIDNVTQVITKLDAVIQVYDLHIWSITSGLHALPCHIVVNSDMQISTASKLIENIKNSLQEVGIRHVTIQLESKQYSSTHNNSLICNMLEQYQPSTCAGHSH